ncbi:hypothetical protein SKAU_G00361660 [Synaphobranchus kaupii]|uniref:Uncharacterized protein n=1 Tax=Synaphobranchus kaupii TaxID=118154 RepID=A0A9Q1EIH0_SYNKA|nr:hypothetical protein SKAU_G00361660 [Synaphobranchus kaupii]
MTTNKTQTVRQCLRTVQNHAHNVIAPHVTLLNPKCEDHDENILARCIIKWAYCPLIGLNDRLRDVKCLLKTAFLQKCNLPDRSRIVDQQTEDAFFKCWCWFISKRISRKRSTSR